MNYGDEQGIITENLDNGNDDSDIENNNVYDDINVERVYIALGNRVTVFVHQTNETKIISADYLPGTNHFPPLVKMLLGKEIQDEVEFQNKTYQVKEIH